MLSEAAIGTGGNEVVGRPGQSTLGYGLSDRDSLPLSRSGSRGSGRPVLTFIVLVAVAVPVELGAAWLAYHTIGEIVSGLLFLAVGLNALAILLYIVRKRALAVAVVLALFLAIVPYQGVLGYRLIALHEEAAGIVAYLYDARLRTGEYPLDLSGYRFRDASLQPYFHEYHRDAQSGGFRLSWYVGTRGTSHYYTPEHGLGYYAD